MALWYRAPAERLRRQAARRACRGSPLRPWPPRRRSRARRWRSSSNASAAGSSIAAYPDSVAITALVPPDHVAQTVRAMTADFFAPVVTAPGFAVAQRDAGEDALLRSVEPDAIEDALGRGPLRGRAVPRRHDAHAAALGDVTLERVRAFAERAFRPANAILILAGNVDAAALRERRRAQRRRVARGARAGRGASAGAADRPTREPLRRTGIITGTGLGWLGPPIADEGAATALDFLADALFAPKTGIVAEGAAAAARRRVTGKFVTYHDPGVFLVTITGDDADGGAPDRREGDRRRRDADGRGRLRRGARRRSSTVCSARWTARSRSPTRTAGTRSRATPAYAPAEGGLQGRYFTPGGDADAGERRPGRRALPRPRRRRSSRSASAPPAAAEGARVIAALAAARCSPRRWRLPRAAAAPRTAVVDLGGARGVRAAPTTASPLAGVELFVRAGLDRQTPAPERPRGAGRRGGAAHAGRPAPARRSPSRSSTRSTRAARRSATSSPAQHVRFYLEGHARRARRGGAAGRARAGARPRSTRLPSPPRAPRSPSASPTRRATRASSGCSCCASSYYRGGAGLPALGDRGLARRARARRRQGVLRALVSARRRVRGGRRPDGRRDRRRRPRARAARCRREPRRRRRSRRGRSARSRKRIVTHRDVARDVRRARLRRAGAGRPRLPGGARAARAARAASSSAPARRRSRPCSARPARSTATTRRPRSSCCGSTARGSIPSRA